MCQGKVASAGVGIIREWCHLQVSENIFRSTAAGVHIDMCFTISVDEQIAERKSCSVQIILEEVAKYIYM